MINTQVAARDQHEKHDSTLNNRDEEDQKVFKQDTFEPRRTAHDSVNFGQNSPQ